jgi:glycosyltransferase involved in cell wall biosynthesis
MATTPALLRNDPIAFVSDYLPRQCGIATFTHDLCEAVAIQAKGSHDVFTVAMNDQPEGYPYPERVRFEVRQSVQADYRLAAEFLNVNQVSTVCLQHEYGIFGGPYGSHILALLKRLRRPVVATLHTVLKDPTEEQRLVMREVTRICSRVVVMSDLAYELLEGIYGVPREKIAMIHHGIPDVPFIDSTFYKDQFGVEGRQVMLTFGLLSPGKGLEYVIEALPAIVRKHPELVYIMLGATHPHVKRENGEEYRNALTRRVHELGMTDHVIFQNRFVTLEELCEFLGAADLYVTPYLNEAQITSGTLAYALGAGKATISTPYWYAAEMLAEGRGRLVPFHDSDAIAEQVIDLLDNDNERHAMRKRAYTFCRRMLWKRVAQDYLDLFDEAGEAWLESRHKIPAARARKVEKQPELPEVDLRHLRTLTDRTGVFHQSLYATPDRRGGYCTDSSAQALTATVMYWDQTHDDSVLGLMQTYLAFLSYAMDEDNGRFHNFMNYDHTWAEGIGSEDSHARALWALGTSVALCPHESMIGLATHLFLRGLPAVASFSSPRAWALSIIGIHAYLRRFGGDSTVRRFRAQLTEQLAELFRDHMADDWPWCEDVVTYSNARLPHALLMSGKWLNRGDYIDLGKAALHWLMKTQTNEDGMLSLIGTEGWYVRGGTRAQFDQQPIEAHALVDACLEAFRVTREKHWLTHAHRAFNWFLGDNDLRTPMYDFTTGGCRDGLHSDRVSENQGAESTLAWLMSLLAMHDLQMEQTLGDLPADKATEQRPVRRPIGSTGPVVGAKVRKHASPHSDGQ